ncbi:MAG: hypothetical protein PF484_11055 [Bacteroidales bacterium]|jgi:tetratricopeptide (TPR) repeat protein|nr:hypothetical protein [Bacteroidales bacterium]
MKKSIIFLFSIFFSIGIFAQVIIRTKSNLPEISDIIAVLDDATGWVLQDNGSWLSAKNKILHFSSEQNLNADEMLKLGRQNFQQLELREVLVGDEQYAILIFKYAGGFFEFPVLRQNFHSNENALYIVFPAKKLNKILSLANDYNEPLAVNLDVFCSGDIINYDAKLLSTQIAYNISRVDKMEEPSQFTMILAVMPTIVNGEKLFRFRYINVFNQESLYRKYLLPANKNKHFKSSYFEVPYQHFIDFFGALTVQKTNFNILEPINFNDFYKRGVLRYERENYEGALNDFRAALRQKPDTDFWPLYALMGSTHHQLKNYNSAIRSFEKAIILGPKDTDQKQTWIRNYYNLGLSHLMLNNKADACSNFQKAKSGGLADDEAIKVIRKNCKGKYKVKK